MKTKVNKGLLLSAFSLLGMIASAQKTISECTLFYDLSIEPANSPQRSDAASGASTTIYLKGNNSRSEMQSPLGNETTIHNGKTGTAAILKEFSGQKLMITLTRNDWDNKNKANTGVLYQVSDEKMTIAGYSCRKATGKMADGKTFVVYFTPELVPANKEYDPTFASLPGLPMQWEIESGKMRFRYTLTRISFDPVQISRFDFPTSGYRVMTYEENQQLKKGN